MNQEHQWGILDEMQVLVSLSRPEPPPTRPKYSKFLTRLIYQTAAELSARRGE